MLARNTLPPLVPYAAASRSPETPCPRLSRTPPPRREILLFQSIHATSDAAFENGLPEIQEVSKLPAGQPQICLHLLLLGRQDPLDRLQLQGAKFSTMMSAQNPSSNLIPL